MTTEYIGETNAKRLARLLVYQRIAQLQTAEVRHNNEAVVLCGPDAGEIGALKHLLGFPPYGVTFADWESKKGLAKLAKTWPSAKSYYGDVKDVLKEGPKNLSLVNLDLMGYLNQERGKLVSLAAQRIAPWGVLFYTFFRGRESGDNWNNLQTVKANTLNGKRVLGNAIVLKKLLGKSFEPVFVLNYRSVHPDKPLRRSTMTILGFQNVPELSAQKREWKKNLGFQLNEGSASGWLSENAQILKRRIGWEVVGLHNKGLSSSKIAEIMNVSISTVGAILANHNR